MQDCRLKRVPERLHRPLSINAPLRRACEVTAIDIHSEYLRILAQNIRVPQGRALTVRNQNFLCDMTGLSGYDTVVLINVLEHLPESDEGVRKF